MINQLISSDYHVFSIMRKIKTKAELKSVGGLLSEKSDEDMAPFGTCGLCYKVRHIILYMNLYGQDNTFTLHNKYFIIPI